MKASKIEDTIRKSKREMIIDLSVPEVKEADKIYVAFNPQKVYEYYPLEIFSNKEFYFPVSDNPIDWGDRRREKGTALLKSEERVLHYIQLLQENNNASILWQDDKHPIIELKEKFYEKYG